jgi:hypothetical protein
VVGAVSGLMALNRASMVSSRCGANRVCPTDADYRAAEDAGSSAKALATVSTVGFGVGLLGAGVGTALFLKAPRDRARAAVTVTPAFGLQSAGVSVAGALE